MTPLSIIGRLLVGGIVLVLLPVLATLMAIAICVGGAVHIVNYIAGGEV